MESDLGFRGIASPAGQVLYIKRCRVRMGYAFYAQNTELI